MPTIPFNYSHVIPNSSLQYDIFGPSTSAQADSWSTVGIPGNGQIGNNLQDAEVSYSGNTQPYSESTKFQEFKAWARNFYNEQPDPTLVHSAQEEYAATPSEIFAEEATAEGTAATAEQDAALNAISDAGEGTVETAGEAAELSAIGESVEAGVLPELGPIGIGMMISKGIGDLINGAEVSNLQQQNLSQYDYNIAHSFGIGAAQQAKIVSDWNNNQISQFNTAGSIASWFSPLAVGITDAVNRSNLQAVPQQYLDNAYTSFGKIDAQSDNVNISMSSSSINPDEMTNGVQTSVSSSTTDTTPLS